MLVGIGPARAIEAMTDDAKNIHWHVNEKTATAIFLPSSDSAQTATMTLKKKSVVDQTITIDSDASYISITCGALPRLIFKPDARGGPTCKLLLGGGDQPTLTFDDKESLPQQGKWIEMLSAAEPTLVLELGSVTYAKVAFPPQAAPATVAVKPVEAPGAPVSKDLLHVVTPAHLSNTARLFDQGVHKKCLLCSGTGYVSVSVQIGSRTNGIFSTPIFENRRERCDHCEGTGILRSNDDVLIRLSGNLVRDMASVDHDDPKSQQVLTDTYDVITKDMIGDRKAWTLLTGNGRSILAQRKPLPGTPVVAMVDVKHAEKEGDDHRRFLVRVLGTDNRVYVDDPTLADELKNGKALMGGYVDKPIEVGDQHITSLHGGFLIAPPITHDWWWWYHDR